MHFVGRNSLIRSFIIILQTSIADCITMFYLPIGLFQVVTIILIFHFILVLSFVGDKAFLHSYKLF